jgi:hypothetical protein
MQSVVNFVPTADGWDLLEDLDDTPLSALPTECRGVFSGRTGAGINHLVAGTETNLYEALSVDFVELTRAASDYSLSPSAYWEFDVYGEGRYATNGEDPVQYSSGPGALFVDMADGDCSLAKSMAIVEEFLVLGNIVGQGDNASIIETQEAGLHWSAQGDPTLWPIIAQQPAIDAQSDFQILHGDGGPITQIVAASEYTAVFRERQTWRMDYVGAPNFFALRKRDNSRGAVVPGTAIAVGNLVYFLSEEGFLVFDGARTSPIGIEKVDRFVRSVVDWTRAGANCSVAHYPSKHSIVWLLPFNLFGRNLGIAYNYELQKWWFIVVYGERIFVMPSRSEAYSMDDTSIGYGDEVMDGAGSLADVNMDTLGVGTSTRRELAIFDATHSAKTFTAAGKMNGSIVTSEYEMPDSRRALIRGVRPVYAGSGSVSVQVGGRFSAGGTTKYSGIQQVNGNGVAPTRSGGRYQRAYFQASGDISQLNGFDYVIGRMGKR